jgi:hypothetical protein
MLFDMNAICNLHTICAEVTSDCARCVQVDMNAICNLHTMCAEITSDCTRSVQVDMNAIVTVLISTHVVCRLT